MVVGQYVVLCGGAIFSSINVAAVGNHKLVGAVLSLLLFMLNDNHLLRNNSDYRFSKFVNAQM